MPLKAILFDLGDTVVRLEPLPTNMPARLESRLADAGVPPAQAAGIAGRVAAAIQRDASEASSTGRREEVDIARLAAEVLAGDGQRPQLAESLADVYGRADISRIAAVTGRAELLDAFRQQGLQLAIVSNTTTSADLLTAMLERFGLAAHFGVMTYSSVAGVRKPHAEIYARTLASLGVDAADALFVGDRLREDVIGPTQAGMRAVLTQEFHRDAHDGEPFAVIQRLEDLRQIVPRL